MRWKQSPPGLLRRGTTVAEFDLNPDGPHSPEATAEAGALLDACSRFLVKERSPDA